ncbi:hypothetical protein BD626DRAFT_548577 [Schizophyllum amplum]|uniref:Meiotically up-regulated gene 113-domain-containing protein n=1 Tax=Schizophyllum amplum TaxID=97359 RepID=A0A550CD68_9AGAR|nr:hypothetical protein BD626DRAFT_548577 [Auriculariopsis ampla]
MQPPKAGLYTYGQPAAPPAPYAPGHRPAASTSVLPSPSPAPLGTPSPNPTPSPGHHQPPYPATPVRPSGHTQASATPPTKPTASKPSPGSKPKRPRANSQPPQPVRRDSPPRKAVGTAVQCAGFTRAGPRCTRLVKTGPALAAMQGSDDDDEAILRFCFQHSKEVLQPTGFYARKNGTWVDFKDWIPEYLEADTKVALRAEMEKSRTLSDEAGYIYTFEIRDPSNPSSIKLKVGRAVNLNKRIDQWGKQCSSKEQVLRGWYPGVVEPDDSDHPVPDGAVSLMKGRVRPGAKGAWCHRLERLIHLELADLALGQVYLDRHWPNVDKPTGNGCGANGLGNGGGKCADCGQIHKEIFEFVRVSHGKYKRKEWESIVRPVIEKWGAFVDAYV